MPFFGDRLCDSQNYPDGKLFLRIGFWRCGFSQKATTFETVTFSKPQNAYFKIGRGYDFPSGRGNQRSVYKTRWIATPGERST